MPGWNPANFEWIMTENSNNRLPAGLICLMIYQWIVVLVSLLFVVNGWVLFLTYRDYGSVLGILVLASWATAMSFASVTMMWRSPIRTGINKVMIENPMRFLSNILVLELLPSPYLE
jgi:hypothetical protein